MITYKKVVALSKKRFIAFHFQKSEPRMRVVNRRRKV